jgi:hypothetical protein
LNDFFQSGYVYTIICEKNVKSLILIHIIINIILLPFCLFQIIIGVLSRNKCSISESNIPIWLIINGSCKLLSFIWIIFYDLLIFKRKNRNYSISTLIVYLSNIMFITLYTYLIIFGYSWINSVESYVQYNNTILLVIYIYI